MPAARAALPSRKAPRAWRRRGLTSPLLALLYHRVTPDVAHDPLGLCVRQSHFEQQMRWLAETCRPVSEAEFLRGLRRPRWPALDRRPRVLVTFDDGYVDNLRHAAPVLHRLGVPAVVFVSTGYTGGDQPFWWDALAQIAFEQKKTGDDVRREFLRLHDELRGAPPAERDARLRELARQSNIPLALADQTRPMTWDELSQWRRMGLSVGGHTRRHPWLSALPDAELHEETLGCRADLRERLGLEAKMFAYPYGAAHSFDARCRDAVREAGFVCGMANIVGDARWARDQTAIPRLIVRDCSAEALERQLRPLTVGDAA